MYVLSNNGDRSCNYYCRGTAVSVTYSERVFVALGTLGTLHFTLLRYSHLQLTPLNFTSLHFLTPSLPFSGFHLPNPRENKRFTKNGLGF